MYDGPECKSLALQFWVASTIRGAAFTWGLEGTTLHELHR